ncbi:protein of unknown function [Methylocaldum szegediense]|uniref:Uncharacterized protein n=1 Tax=Methylocaldum szegediense TaxID=73780 RepID=A0ABM9HWT5_9GAMM|nr:protein of unknown function [Methylocaldum szegediense]
MSLGHAFWQTKATSAEATIPPETEWDEHRSLEGGWCPEKDVVTGPSKGTPDRVCRSHSPAWRDSLPKTASFSSVYQR